MANAVILKSYTRFTSLYIIVAAKPPKVRSQPMSQKDVLPGKAVAFSVEATGTLPLKFQWQWKQFGKKGEKDGWQNLSGDSGTFQVGEIQACNAGNYRCVVSNCAGSETSQCASFTVGKYVPIVISSNISTSTCKHSITNFCLLCAQSLRYGTLIVSCMRSLIGSHWASTLGLNYRN